MGGLGFRRGRGDGGKVGRLVGVFWRKSDCGGLGRLGIEGRKRKDEAINRYERNCTLDVGDCVMIFRG